ncbi:unnamed protein product [Effrenium voratum]|uniref:Uncharacterized protein n=1 Tax=Effrenium voratum TaxID=2562239 RepID=A0AA36J2I8_9DINO|nr:unnamed protein product [Effrenium voratum]CAJ1425592.1 unnamed protein product [Effrenium voratum]
MDAQSVANVLYAIAKASADSTHTEALLRLLPGLATRIPFVTSRMKAQEVANAIWAVAKLAINGSESEVLLGLLPALAGTIPEVISEMNAQAVANVIWATGQLSGDESRMVDELHAMLPSLVARAEVLLPAATPQEIANTCWGLALSHYHDAGYLQAVIQRVAEEAGQWKPRGAEMDLPSLLCALARLEASQHEDLLGVVAQKLSPMLAAMNSWGLCALAWSYQELDLNDDHLAFRQTLDEELSRRGLSERDVDSSRLGPERWRRDGR